jgi:hypothetical protein
VSEEMVGYMAAPTKHGDPLLPRRSSSSGMLPSTWLNRSVRVEYADGFGSAVERSGALLDTYAAGPILSLAGTKTLIAWDTLRVVELVEEGGG